MNNLVKEPETQVAAIDVSLTCDAGAGRMLQFRTFIERDANTAWINHLLDRLNKVADRQKAIYSLEEEESRLRVEEQGLVRFSEQMDAIDRKNEAAELAWHEGGQRRRPYQIPEKEIQHKAQLAESLRLHAKAIEDRKANIAKLKALIGEKAAA